MTDPDVLVVGAGSSGCALAAGLVRRGVRVTLVEAGPDYGPIHAGGWPADLLGALIMPRSHDWGYRETRGEELREERRAKVVGGCSSHNQCAAIWPQPGDLDAWSVPGWSDADLAPALAEVRTALAPRRAEGLSLWQQTFVDCSADAEPFEANIRDGVRWNAAFAFLDPVRDDPLLTVRAGLTVDRVVFDGRRARAVVAGGEELGARRIVLCGGAFGTPEILVRSGVTDLPIGENLHDHTGFRLELQPNAAYAEQFVREQIEGAVSQSQVILPLRSRGYGDGFDLHAMPFVSIDDEGVHHLVVYVFVLDPESRGRLTVLESETVIDFARFSVPRDLERGRDGAGQVRALLRGVPEIEDELPEGVTGYAHPVGTCAFGDVVRPGLDVIGVAGLYVADASIVPRIPRANTNVLCMGIGVRAAEMLA